WILSSGVCALSDRYCLQVSTISQVATVFGCLLSLMYMQSSGVYCRTGGYCLRVSVLSQIDAVF
ncbi:hypothetical protein NDU88_000935, partial [Pleurodeles waltl]